MTPAHTGEDRLAALHGFAILLFAAIAAGRMAYIASCPPPLVENSRHLLWTVPVLAIGAYYTYIRANTTIAALFNGLGLAGIGVTGSGLASTLATYTGRSFPLADETLEAADRLIGFDWLAVLQFFDSHPYLDRIVSAAYGTIISQLPVIIVALALTHQTERLYRFLAAVNIALVITSIVAIFFPALGPYEFLHLSAADHPHIDLITADKMTAPILWLRAAAFTAPVPDFTVGLISFPSFHAATAAIYIWAMWRTPVIRWFGLTLNGLMLIATPIQGSHYLVDVFAGLAVAAGAIVAAAWMLGRVRRARQPALSAAESPA
jgi:hypothetical protein